MNLEKLNRSNNVHSDLKNKAYNIMYDCEINVVVRRLAKRKYDYHNEVLYQQNSKKRILTKSERKKIWKSTR